MFLQVEKEPTVTFTFLSNAHLLVINSYFSIFSLHISFFREKEKQFIFKVFLYCVLSVETE